MPLLALGLRPPRRVELHDKLELDFATGTCTHGPRTGIPLAVRSMYVRKCMAVVDDVDFRAAGAFPVEGELIPQIAGAIAIATGRGS